MVIYSALEAGAKMQSKLFGKLSDVHFLLVICLLPVSSPLWTFMIIIIDKEMDHSAILSCPVWT